MNLYTSLLVSLCTVISGSSMAAATEDESPENTIVLIESMEPGQSFQISPEQQLRIPFTAIAGTSISAKITGPAKIVAHNRIVPMKENTGPDGEKTPGRLQRTFCYNGRANLTG